MKHLYLFDEYDSNAAKYGVGTYINSIITSLSGYNLRITIVKLMSAIDELQIEEQKDCRYIYIPKLNSPHALRKNYLRNICYVLISLIDSNDDIVFHFNYLSSNALIKQLKKHIAAQCVLTIHYRELDTSENIEQEKELINEQADKVIVLATHAFDSLIKDYGTSTGKITLIPNGLQDSYRDITNSQHQILCEHFGISYDKQIILFVGRLDENKNVSSLIRAFLSLVAMHKDIHLVIAGSGYFEPLLKEINHSWGRITFTGFLEKEELIKLYHIADIGVIPSNYEEFGYVALEMMMYHIPIVANNTSGLKDIIIDEETGLLVNLNSKDGDKGLTTAISDLLTNKEKRHLLGHNARKRFLMEYEMSVFKDNMINTYNTLFK